MELLIFSQYCWYSLHFFKKKICFYFQRICIVFLPSSSFLFAFILCWYILPSKVDSELISELARRVIVLPLCSHSIKNKSFYHRDKFTGNSQPGRWLLAVLSGHLFPLLGLCESAFWNAFYCLIVLWARWCETLGLTTLKFRKKMFICEIFPRREVFVCE